ncbi:MAG: PLP-dependent transferase, partial [Opitutales bacterium]|nr:PLP-dependent transferase [Opitutales bacterium]
MKFATAAIHAGQAADPATGATIVPIYQTSTFTQQAVGVHKGYEYSRSGNPTRAALEECLAKLENGRFGLAFASGLAANMAVLSALSKGDKIAAVADLYGGTFRIFEKILRPLGIETAYIQGDSDAEIKAALSGAKMLWSESPTNPTMRIADIARLAKL